MEKFPGSTGPQPHQAVLALTADLMFGARVRSTADAVGVSIRMARSRQDVLDAARDLAPRLIIIDLDARMLDPVDLIRALKADPVTAVSPILAYVSHVREDLIAAARQAGAERVMARGAFARQLPSLLAPQAE